MGKTRSFREVQKKLCKETQRMEVVIFWGEGEHDVSSSLCVPLTSAPLASDS